MNFYGFFFHRNRASLLFSDSMDISFFFLKKCFHDWCDPLSWFGDTFFEFAANLLTILKNKHFVNWWAFTISVFGITGKTSSFDIFIIKPISLVAPAPVLILFNLVVALITSSNLFLPFVLALCCWKEGPIQKTYLSVFKVLLGFWAFLWLYLLV